MKNSDVIMTNVDKYFFSTNAFFISSYYDCFFPVQN